MFSFIKSFASFFGIWFLFLELHGHSISSLCLVSQTWMQNWSKGFWQNQPSEQPQCFPEPLLGIVALSTAVCGSRASETCSGNPSGGQRGGSAGSWRSDPAVLCLLSAGKSDAAPPALLFCGVMPNFLCPCIYQEGDSCSQVLHSNPLSKEWHEDVFPVLIHEKVMSPSAFWGHDVSRPQTGHLWVVGLTATTVSNSSCMSC